MKMNLQRGQSLTESVLVMPIYFLFFFGVLQAAQLGIALLVTNYAASSIARKAANEKAFTASTAMVTPAPMVKGSYQQKATSLLVAGMSLDDMIGCVVRDDLNVPTAELEVSVRTQIRAWPFFADVLHGVLKGQYATQALACPDLGGNGAFGPFNFSGQAPYFFYVTGRSKVRLNYVP